METLIFGNKDQMPVLGLGTWKSSRDEVYTTILEAIKLGYRHIDCAPIYGNQAAIGHALNEAFAQNLVKREDIWITSKLWNNAHKQEDVTTALKQTLDELQLDYLDLFLIHWPIAIKSDIRHPENANDFISLDNIPISETWKGMEYQLKKGNCRHIGVSNFSLKKLQELVQNAEIKPEVNQIESHPYLQQTELLEYCKKNNIHYTAYSPLGAGKSDDKLSSLITNSSIQSIARKNKCTSAQILLKWGIQRGTSVIPKTTNIGRLKENFNSLKVVLHPDDKIKISELDKHHRFIDGKFWMYDGSPYTLKKLWDE